MGEVLLKRRYPKKEQIKSAHKEERWKRKSQTDVLPQQGKYLKR